MPNERDTPARPWTPEEVDQLRRMAAEDALLPVIAKALGRSNPAVLHKAREEGVVVRTDPFQPGSILRRSTFN